MPAFAALVIEDNLNGASSKFDWQSINGACLTAGNGTGSIPACKGLAYYSGKTLVGGEKGTLPDDVGSGALRLSNGAPNSGDNGNNQTGAVYSKFSFPSNAGVDITFKTVTYGGNNFEGIGADGIVFFSPMRTRPVPSTATPRSGHLAAAWATAAPTARIPATAFMARISAWASMNMEISPTRTTTRQAATTAARTA
ncbi:hypothetical protein ACFQOZ_12575 [Comamonas endophytica]|uniref:hypothetical protein n=1 Tax=Comamonas endophytica TaxID=2949090 RepID=UPI00361E7CA5